MRAKSFFLKRRREIAKKGGDGSMGDGKDQIAQPQLVPVEAWFCGPIETGTADASDGCFCRDNTGWIIKKIEVSNPFSPHNEWFCANLAAKTGVPVAPFNVVKHTDKKDWFGSQFQIGEVTDWWDKVISGSINLDDIRKDLCRIYAFDLFINNVDRHQKNYMITELEGKYRAMAIDHGRAWLFNNFPPSDPPMSYCNTIGFFGWMKQNFIGFPEKQPMVEILTSISKVSSADVVDILSRQPDIWLDQANKDVIVEWWKSGKALDRAISLINGVTDGSLV